MMLKVLPAFRAVLPLFGPRKHQRTTVRLSTVRLMVDELENRLAPAAFTVDTLLDTPDANVGDGLARDAQGRTSLRAAIQEGNASGDASITVGFQAGLMGAITLTESLPTLAKNFTISGPGSQNLTVLRSTAMGTGNFRIFTIGEGKTCEITDLSITNGRQNIGGGGGIRNAGNLTIRRLDIYNNWTGGGGGGIFNATTGTLTVQECYIWGNEAAFDGGGIDNEGTLYIQYISHIFANTAAFRGGGIYNKAFADLLISDSSEIYANTAGSVGGGIANYGNLTMQSGLIELNGTGGEGGGIYSEGTATFLNVSFQHNSAQKGGGFYVQAGTTTLDSCIISNNTASVLGAGGAWKTGSTLNTINCTITDPIVQDP